MAHGRARRGRLSYPISFDELFPGTRRVMAEADEKIKRKVVNAWCMYDWANSAFATTILAAVFPIYYGTVAGAALPGNRATVYYGYTASLALLVETWGQSPY